MFYIHTNDTGGSLRLHLSSLGQELKFWFANLKFKKESPEVRVTSGQNFVPRLFTLYCKLLCDCFKYLLKRNHFQQHQMSKTNFEDHMTLKSPSEMKTDGKNFYLCLDNFSELWNLFSRVPMRNCFWCYFRQLFISLAFRKCIKDVHILIIILVQEIYPLKNWNCSISYRILSWTPWTELRWSSKK